jgi:hypothetical protein
LADFSGYVAADELYDGPFCILSAVDNRRYKRLLYDVLDHDPTHDDIRAFLGRLKTALSARALPLFGVTTDGSALYPAPLLEVFGDVPHQICTFYDLEILRSKWHKAIREQSLTPLEHKEKILPCTHALGRSPCYPSRACRRRLPEGWPSFGVSFVAKRAGSM